MAGREGMGSCRYWLLAASGACQTLQMQTRPHAPFLTLVLLVASSLAGCSTPPESAGIEKEEKPYEMVEAPVGSRIKRKSYDNSTKPEVNPISTVSRETLEQDRAQQAVRQQGFVNDPSKYLGPR